jgi:hypothetical protein
MFVSIRPSVASTQASGQARQHTDTLKRCLRERATISMHQRWPDRTHLHVEERQLQVWLLQADKMVLQPEVLLSA